MAPPLWIPAEIAGQNFQALSLDHPAIEARILAEIESGVDVYYDRRWDVTGRLCRLLLADPRRVAGRTILVLGAGVGLETVVIGHLCKKLYINDLAPAALDLCGLQLEQNGILNYQSLPGRYETLPLPAIDLAVGCFLVYNPETARAMEQFLGRCTAPVLLMNNATPHFQRLIRTAPRKTRALLSPEDLPCVLFE